MIKFLLCERKDIKRIMLLHVNILYVDKCIGQSDQFKVCLLYLPVHIHNALLI